MTLEIINIVTIGYGVLLAMLILEMYKKEIIIEDLEEDLDNMIDKHNGLAEGFIRLSQEVDKLKDKNNG
mgnify:CR=1 FL=1|tara:strand:+ start:238 stop:444 length:207 start_codon:yes stop_codon:yes gene_type:complete